MAEEWYNGAYYNRRFTFRFGDCDSQKKATLYSIMKLLSEISGDDYEGRGLGHTKLQKNGQAMLLSRLALKFNQTPKCSDKVISTTWERFTKGPFFYRDFEITNENGGLLVSGSSMWLLVDTVSREILRPEKLIIGSRRADSRKSDCTDCAKIKKYTDLPVIGLRNVYYSDIDGNGHVNNAVYGRIATDFLPLDLREKDIKQFLINFYMEVKPNETLEICGAEVDGGYVVQGASKDTIHFCSKFDY